MKDPIIKITCNEKECDNYTYCEIEAHFDGRCNICDQKNVQVSSPSIKEILEFAEVELENANYHHIINLPTELFKNITNQIILAPNEEKFLANIITMTFYKSI